MSKETLKVAVSISKNQDAREAGREVVETILDKLGENPCLLLLFSTIHYRKDSGFKKFIKGVWDLLPKETPLVGGTVSGFINNYGCFSRGTTAIGISYPNIDVATGFGLHTKRSPKKAAKHCANMIKRKLEDTEYKNKFLINMISAPIIPKLPLIGMVNKVTSKFWGEVLSRIGMPLACFFGTGIAKEKDVQYTLASLLPDFYIIGGSSVDDGRMTSNYQFVGKKIYTNSVVAAGCALDLNIDIKEHIAVNLTNKHFRITRTLFENRIIKEIEGQPAKKYLLEEILKISEDVFKELGPFYYKASDYLPLTFQERKESVLGIGGILGNNILMSHKIEGKEAILCSITGKKIVEDIKKFVSEIPAQSSFIFIVGSAIYSYILGSKMFEIKKIFDEAFGKKPYLMILPIIENVRILNKKPSVRAYSINALTIKGDSNET